MNKSWTLVVGAWFLFAILFGAYRAAYGTLPEGSTVNLANQIPVERCGVWAQNVANVLNSDNPTRALQMWTIINPQDGRLMQLTFDYIMASDIRSSDNFFGTANADCLLSHGREIGI